MISFRTIAFLIAALFLLLIAGNFSNFVNKAMGGWVDEHRVVLPLYAQAELLAQCSRRAPEPTGKGWTPTLADLNRMDEVVVEQLREIGQVYRTELPKELSGHVAQYGGIVRDGARFIYANYHIADDVLLDEEPGIDYENKPMVVCHGGPQYFGAEYDVENGVITHIDFNDFGPMPRNFEAIESEGVVTDRR